MIGPLSYTDSPFGKPDLTVHLTNMQCTGSEANLTKCSSEELEYEEGKSLALETSVAGVKCKIPSTPPVCPTTQCSTNCKVTVTPRVAPVRGGEPQTMTFILLAISTAVLSIVVIVLGVR